MRSAELRASTKLVDEERHGQMTSLCTFKEAVNASSALA